MDSFAIWFLPVIGGLISFVLIGFFVTMPGRILQGKFQKLGILKGKTLAEITKACGQPNAISTGVNNQKICQWIQAGYHVVLIFDENDICLGVSSETNI